MSHIYNWDVTASNNANADGAIDWAEGMSPANVNDSARVMMARVKEFIIDIGGSKAATGTANAISVATESAFTALANGLILSFRAVASNTTATTLNVNGLGAKPILKATSAGITALVGREIQSTGMYTVQYSTALNGGSGAWLLVNPTNTAVPPGVMAEFGGLAAPEGWLLCGGQAVSRTTYADLYTAIGTTWGVGDGTTTFNLPDYRGRVGAGKDDMGGTSANRLTGVSGSLDGDTLGATGGSETHTLTTAEMPAHTHTGTTDSSGNHSHTVSYVDRGDGFGSSPAMSSTTGASTKTTSTAGAHTHDFTTGSAGTGGAHPNVQPTIIVTKIIKY